MKEINEEIKLTLDLIQADINLGAHGELQKHLNSLLRQGHCEVHPHVPAEYPCPVCLEDKRKSSVDWERVLEHHKLKLAECTITKLQAELERERERRFEGNRIASAEHREEIERLVGILEEIVKAAPSRGPLWHGSNQIVEARAAIAGYRKEFVTHDAKPQPTEQQPADYELVRLRKRVKELEAALNDQLNDCINFDGGKLTDTIMEKSAVILRGGVRYETSKA